MDDISMVGIGPWLKFIWEAHIANPLWIEKGRRREIRSEKFFNYKETYLKKYIPYARRIPLPQVESEDKDSGNDTIFSIWFQGVENAPELIQACLKSQQERYPDKFKLLSLDDIRNYVDIPEFIWEKYDKGEIGPAHFSDICRLELLYRYGGYWMDATCLMTGNIPDNIAATDFFMYVPGKEMLEFMFVQNCFIRGKKGNPLVRMWLDLIYEYWKHEQKAIHYFVGHMLFKMLVTYNEEAKRLIEKMPKIDMFPSHVLWHSIGDHPYNKEEFDKMCREAFFQKCNIKFIKGALYGIKPGTNAAHAFENLISDK